MTESLSVVGDVSAEMEEQMRSTARTVAQETTYSAQQAAEGYYYLASAGLEAEEQIAALPEVASFATAGNIEMAEASDYATDIMKAFGYEADELDTVMDTLTATFTNHNQTAQDMGTAMSYVAPVAEAAGMSIQETSAAIGMMGDAGIKGSKAGTSLRQAIASLQSPTSKQAELMNELGINATDSEGNLLGMTEIIRQLEQAGAGSAEVMELFGTQAGPGMQVLLSEGSAALDKNTQKIRESGGVTQEVAEKQLQTFNNQLQILKSRVEEVFIAMGQNLLPVMNGLVQIAIDAVGAFANINSSTNGLLGVVILLTGLVGGLAMAIGSAVNAGLTLTSVLLPLKTGLSVIGGVIGGLTLPLVALIGTIVALAAAWKTNFGGIRTQTMRVVKALRDALSPVLDLFGGKSVNILGMVKQAWNSFIAIAEPIFATLFTWFADKLIVGIEAFGNVLRVVIPAAIGLWNQLKSGVGGAINFIRNSVIAPFVEWFAPVFRKNVMPVIKEAQRTFKVWQEIATYVFDTIQKRVGAFIEWFSPYWNSWLGDTRQSFNTQMAGIRDLWDKYGDEIITIVNFLTDTVSGVFKGFFKVISTSAQSFFALLRGDWRTMLEVWLDLFKDIGGGIISFVEKWGGKLTGGIGDIVDAVVGWFEDLYEKLIGGSIVPDMFNDILGATKQFAKDFVNFYKGIFEDVISGMTSFATDATNKIDNIMDDVLGKITGVASDFKAAGGDLVESLADGISGAVGSATDAAGDVVGKIRDFLPGSDADTGPLSDLEASSLSLSQTLGEKMLDGTRFVERASQQLAQAATIDAQASTPSYDGSGYSLNQAVSSLTSEVEGLRRDVRRGSDKRVELDGKKVGSTVDKTMSRKTHQWEVSR
ncbi:phage tail tape measure protein, TP901 family [Halalkalicoccus jeotgali B3]|uniref:Phage tail tape measure protein, TP901 family n=2 Tax=Halalkalicoccus jeotgali TaxID=413810 RepID=D8JAW3_HALJB|nr:phage tail tape measure protein, TP901 family [Halalkalicoccus jeotgali B3]ELY39418.1 phage tail tape measure protein, TP901 family [Halalkalicoccus jeotgali B3]